MTRCRAAGGLSDAGLASDRALPLVLHFGSSTPNLRWQGVAQLRVLLCSLSPVPAKQRCNRVASLQSATLATKLLLVILAQEGQAGMPAEPRMSLDCSGLPRGCSPLPPQRSREVATGLVGGMSAAVATRGAQGLVTWCSPAQKARALQRLKASRKPRTWCALTCNQRFSAGARHVETERWGRS